MALQAAIDALVEKQPVDPVLNYGALDAVIADAENKLTGNYTQDSLDALSAALEDAKNVRAAATTQKELDDAVVALQAAIDALVEKQPVALDYDELLKQIDAAKALYEYDYTKKSWATMKTAYDAAVALLPDKAPDQDTIDNATKALKNAIDNLIDAPSYMALKALVNKIRIENLNSNDYTETSWKTFEAAFNAADLMANEMNAETQDEVNAVYEALDNAYKALEKKSVVLDYSELLKQIEAADALNKDDYTVDSWAAMKTAYDKAKALLTDSEATQNKIEDATAALKDAIDSLVKKLNYSALEEQINRADLLNENDYTAISWATMKTAYDAAVALLPDKAPDQDTIDNATKALKDALDELEKKPVTPPATPDFTELDRLIAKAEVIISDRKWGAQHYTLASIDKLAPVYNTIKEKRDSGVLTTQEAIDAATKELNDAFAKLVVLSAPTLGDVTAGTHTQLRGETVITDDRMTLNVKTDGISAKEYIALLNFNIEGEEFTTIITVDGVNIADIDENTLIYTGAKVTVVAKNRAGESEIRNYTVIVMGDCSGDGVIKLMDIVKGCRHIGGETLDDLKAQAMEMNAHAGIDIGDLVRLAYIIGGQ